jgi:hypothetical protein
MIEASHFDPSVAYVAVDRHRLDDQTPYLYRTRDYGQTWQLITTGIAANSFVNAIREDPQKRGLLFAGTELGIYVSFDDGAHWQPLQLNLPVTSVRDITIHGDDLIIATFGRSFWILDDITPVRQMIPPPQNVRLYQPATAIRVDNDAFLGTPLPPDEPAAKNPPEGAIIDYYLPATAQSLTLEIFDSGGRLVQRYIGGPMRQQPHPPLPIAERWLIPPVALETTPGAHRFLWDLRWAAPGASSASEAEEGFRAPRGPQVVPGTYQLKLTADGKLFAQTLKVEMDPRSPATAAELNEQLRLGLEIFAEVENSRKALSELGAVRKQLHQIETQSLKHHERLLSQLAEMDAAIQQIENGQATTPGAVTGLRQANMGLAAALYVVESGDRPAPSQALNLYHQADQAAKTAMAGWQELTSNRLPKLNEALRKAGLAAISVPAE